MDAEGHPVVALSWEIPPRYSEEAFRVYARGGSAGGYILIATVTSCSDGVCRYDDTNVVHGGSYDYYVATVDEWDGSEWGSSEAIRVDVPDFDPVAAPAARIVPLVIIGIVSAVVIVAEIAMLCHASPPCRNRCAAA